RAHRCQRPCELQRHAVGQVHAFGLQPVELQLDVGPQPPRVRVEDEQRERPLCERDVDLARDRLHRAVEREGRDGGRVPDLVARVVVGGLDRRARERVVKLVEEQQLPRLPELAPWVRLQVEEVGDDTPLLGALQHVLRTPVPSLDPGMRRVAAGCVVLQVASPLRQVALLDRVEEAAQRAQLEPPAVLARVERFDRAQVRARRAAAVVSDAVEDGELVEVRRQRGERALDVVAEVLARRAVLVRDAVGGDGRAVRRLPPEERSRHGRVLLRLRPQEDIRVHALAAQDLRQRRVVAERVEVRAGRRGDAEAVEQVALAVEALPDERLTGRDVAVRLDPPAADDLPAAAGDVLANTGEELGVALLDPLQEEHGGVREDEVRVLVEPVERGRERRAHLLVALRPLPEPHRVDVRVPDHVEAPARLRHVAAQRSTSSRMTWSRSTCISCTRAVSSDGTISAMSAWSAAGTPRPPPNTTVVPPVSRASARALTTFGERPLVVNPTTTSPGRTNARTWRAKMSSNSKSFAMQVSVVGSAANDCAG